MAWHCLGSLDEMTTRGLRVDGEPLSREWIFWLFQYKRQIGLMGRVVRRQHR
jgi:hypothetical protein